MQFSDVLSGERELFPFSYAKWVKRGCFNTNALEHFTFKSERPLAALVYSDCAQLRNS